MYKKDAVYTGSVKNLQEFKSHHENVEKFTRSNISIKVENTQNCCQRNPAYKVLVDIVKEMTDFKLLGQNKQFLLVTLANFFSFAPLFVPYIYIPIYAKELGIDNYPIILSIIGKPLLIMQLEGWIFSLLKNTIKHTFAKKKKLIFD